MFDWGKSGVSVFVSVIVVEDNESSDTRRRVKFKTLSSVRLVDDGGECRSHFNC